MFARLHAQFHEVRLDLRNRRLRHRERLGLRRLGEEVARADAGGNEAFARLVGEIAEGERRAAALAVQGRASLDADRVDLRSVAPWVKPVVVLRGLCTRQVLRHRRARERQALRPCFEASAIRSLGIGSGGTRVVSSSTYEAMTFWLPLLAAALCAYLGERLGAYYRGRGSVDR
jgi:hypothetical protein